MPQGRLVAGELAKAVETAGRKTVAGSYTVFKDGTVWYGESLTGGADKTSVVSIGDIVQQCSDAITTGTIWVKQGAGTPTGYTPKAGVNVIVDEAIPVLRGGRAWYDILTDGSVYWADAKTIGLKPFFNTNCALLHQSLFDYIATFAAITPPVSGGTNAYGGLTLRYGPGQFYFPSKVTVNMPGGAGGVGLKMFGSGEDSTNLVLSSGANDDMFEIISLGNKLEVYNIKFLGQRTLQTGTSNCFDFTASSLGGEFIIAHCEFRDWLNACFSINSANVQWTTFQEVWMLNAAVGIDFVSTRSDIRVQNSKFALLTDSAIKLSSGNLTMVAITGNILDGVAISLPTGAPKKIKISNNLFNAPPNNCINWPGTGLGSLTDTESMISDNLFRATTGTNVAILLGNRVDDVGILANRFIGYTPSATVPITLIQTAQKLKTFVQGNSGLGVAWVGFGITQPAVPATGVDQQNLNPFPVRVYITGVGTGITAYGITDQLGTLTSFTKTVVVGDYFEIPAYGKIRLTYTGSPTWVWVGEGNLS